MLFAIFMISAVFAVLFQQIMPQFIFQRQLYEVRERPSKTYHYAAFMIANIFVEIPYQILLGVMVFGCFIYPVFGVISSENQGISLLILVEFFIWGSTFAHAVVAVLPDAETAAQIATLIFYLLLIFNGILVQSGALPGFWIFMYRLSPMTYIISGIAVGLTGRRVDCAHDELSIFQPRPNMTCAQYMQPFFQAAGSLAGNLLNPNDMRNCEYCEMKVTDEFLETRNIKSSQRWRNVGLVWAYIGFNVFFAVIVYYLFRVKTWKKR